MKNKLNNVLILSVLLPNFIFGATDSTGIQSYINQINSILIENIGPAIITLGVVIAGISFVGNVNQTGIKRGIYTVIGGAVITLAQTIGTAIQGFGS